ncbi:MAG: alpha/beta fold hydrolase [Acidobacteriota bacterium]|nr:alpha/beta fold hydrolase [Acidobacteriota bacterium]
MLTYNSDGSTLAYSESGSGIPVVFLHPTPFDHQYWLPLISELKGVRAIAPDFRGHGASELGSNLPVGLFSRVPDVPVLTMSQLAADTIALLDQLKIESAVFAGCSIGGYVLFELWRQVPQRIRGLAFVCSKPQPDAEANLERRAATIAKARAGETPALYDGMTQTLIGATARAKRPEIVQELRATMTMSSEGLVATQAGLATRPDSMPTVAAITVPVLAIAGVEDVGITVEEMRALESAPGGCTFHALAEAGHLAAYEQPHTVVRMFAEWLRAISG